MSQHKMQLDPETFERLSEIGATLQEIAFVMGISLSTVERRLLDPEFRVARDRGMGGMKISIRRAQLQSALGYTTPDGKYQKPDVTAQIWLGKQYLGQKDRQEVTGADDRPLFDVGSVRNYILNAPEDGEKPCSVQ